MKIHLPALVFTILLASSCSFENSPSIQSDGLELSFNNHLHTKVHYNGAESSFMDDYQPSEIIKVGDSILSNFNLEEYSLNSVDDERGSGKMLVVTGNYEDSNYNLTKRVTATAYDDFPNLLTTRVEYINNGNEAVPIKGWDNNRYVLKSLENTPEDEKFWSFQSASYPSRQDWILPVGEGFRQKNYQGMNASDYGGGTPVVDVWRRDAGLAVGHLETEPQLVSLPVEVTNIENTEVQLSISFESDSVSALKYPRSIKPGESIATFETFITGHTGDYYTSLKRYREMMARKGIEFSEPPQTAYEPIWCAWGYGRDFTLEKVIKTLPKVKELGFDWAVLDDGWQIAEGDWRTNDKFRETTMKEFVDVVHDHGLKAKLWWAPLAADPGSRVHEEESEMLLVNKQGTYQRISWWNSHYLNPALTSTKEYHKQLVRLFMEEWGYDGLKIDGQHLNQVPPDYAENNGQRYPEESLEELPDLYRDIYTTALDIKPEAVVEICPCGASGSSFIMPYMNQSVSSDPLSSWQIRHKGKTYKALMGENAAYYGDHVELSDNQNDFASTVGIGGVIGTKFTWPESSAPGNRHLLTDEKEELIKKWMGIYKEYMLPQGTYRGELYDIGFDYPEGHAVEKDGKMFYSFYADSYEGPVELRGLSGSNSYRIINFETGEEIAKIDGSDTRIQTRFDHHLMVRAQPLEPGD